MRSYSICLPLIYFTQFNTLKVPVYCLSNKKVADCLILRTIKVAEQKTTANWSSVLGPWDPKRSAFHLLEWFCKFLTNRLGFLQRPLGIWNTKTLIKTTQVINNGACLFFPLWVQGMLKKKWQIKWGHWIPRILSSILHLWLTLLPSNKSSIFWVRMKFGKFLTHNFSGNQLAGSHSFFKPSLTCL